ncbi:MAG TPA: hypothetical protein V6D20_02670, partial [Candidatus Obscuribacterales bacterium]
DKIGEYRMDIGCCPFCGDRPFNLGGYNLHQVACKNGACPIDGVAMMPEDWQAATEQGEPEPVGWFNSKCLGSIEWKAGLSRPEEGTKFYTQPPKPTRGVMEPFGSDSAYAAAMEHGLGNNMTISCGLVVELIDALRSARKPTGGGVPECPYPCGWRELHTIITKKAAYFASATLGDEPWSDQAREYGIDLGIYARELCSLLATQQPPDNPPKEMPEATRQHTANVSRVGGNQ